MSSGYTTRQRHQQTISPFCTKNNCFKYSFSVPIQFILLQDWKIHRNKLCRKRPHIDTLLLLLITGGHVTESLPDENRKVHRSNTKRNTLFCITLQYAHNVHKRVHKNNKRKTRYTAGKRWFTRREYNLSVNAGVILV